MGMRPQGSNPAGLTARPPETVDRMMIGACAAIWLVWLAASVFATVGMVRLGGGHTGGEQRSSWLLYGVIVVSALIIIGAIPLLIRARRTARADGAADRSSSAAVAPTSEPTPETPADTMRVFGVDPAVRRSPETGPSGATDALESVVDRILLRGTAALLGVMGLALTAVAVGAWLLAGRNDTEAWVAFGLAGVITAAMPAVLVFFQRQLGG
ncbi:MAG: DUF2561 family protein [Mycobacterium sp.]|nr:DUF2561 family protein [Mycobacterium sp.]